MKKKDVGYKVVVNKNGVRQSLHSYRLNFFGLTVQYSTTRNTPKDRTVFVFPDYGSACNAGFQPIVGTTIEILKCNGYKTNKGVEEIRKKSDKLELMIAGNTAFMHSVRLLAKVL